MDKLPLGDDGFGCEIAFGVARRLTRDTMDLGVILMFAGVACIRARRTAGRLLNGAPF